MKRGAFTLIELMVSIVILSILMLFLYKSYADLNKTNKVYEAEVKKLKKASLLRETLYLDILLASKESMVITHESPEFDFVSFSTVHSLHRLIKPYVAYIIKEGMLYRLESNKKIDSAQISREQQFIVDKIGKVVKFKLFRATKAIPLFLLDAEFQGLAPFLVKIKALN